MSYSVIVTPNFDKEAKHLKKKYPSLKGELTELIVSLENDPIQGTSIGHGCYKIRLGIASKGKGKSGGARIITYISIINSKVYLVSIFDKSEKETISGHELVALLQDVPLKG